MKTNLYRWIHKGFVAAALAGLAIVPSLARSEVRALSGPETAIAQKIRKELSVLANYGVFDHLKFSVNGSQVVLSGYASRPTLKSAAEIVAKRVEGVDSIVNEIEILPLSRFDDRIRTQAYARIYGHSVLSRYDPGRGVPMFWPPARAAAGITNDPPIGNHPIRIIVNNGNITLEGVVDNEGDKAIAGMQANTTPGAFAVINNLRVARPATAD
jgi:hypothetical protein